MKKLFLSLLILFITASYALCATNSYDRYGSKTGSYKSNSSGTINHYDKYGSKTKSYKKTYTYKVYENKIYKFLAFDKNNNILEDSIKITNISNSSKTENEPKKEEPKEETKTEIKATKLSILNGNLIKAISGSCTYLLYLEKGKSYSFNHNIEPVNTTNKTISLSSSNSNVSINSNTITANSIGNTVVTIKSNSNSNLNVKVRVIILPSSVFNANTYSKVKVLSTITKKDFNIKYNVPVDSSIYITQSMAITSKYIIFNHKLFLLF